MSQTIKISKIYIGDDIADTNVYALTYDGDNKPNPGFITAGQIKAGKAIIRVPDGVSELTVTCQSGLCKGTSTVVNWIPIAVTPTPTITPSPTVTPTLGITPTPTITPTPVTPTPVTPTPVTPTPVTQAPVPPVVPTPTPTTTVTPTPAGPTYYPHTMTSILPSVNAACGDAVDVVYYTLNSSLTPGDQLYSDQSGTQVTTTGYIFDGTNQWNVPNGVLGSAGTCPVEATVYNFWISGGQVSDADLCNANYLLSNAVTSVANGPLPSNLLGETIDDNGSAFNGMDLWYAVDNISGRETQDTNLFYAIQIDSTGLVVDIVSRTCTGTPNPTPTPDVPTPAPQPPVPGQEPAVSPKPDTPQEL